MLIRSRMGISADGFVSTAEGVPTQAIMPEFVPGVSHGFPEFIDGCDAVVMGRNTFVPALGAPGWPWPNLQVFVLTSRPLPANAPADVIAVDEPAALAERLRTRGSDATFTWSAGRGPSAPSTRSARSTGSSCSYCRSCSRTGSRCGRGRLRGSRSGCCARTAPSATARPSSSTPPVNQTPGSRRGVLD